MRYTNKQLKADLKLLAKLKGFAPLTPEEAQKAYDEAEPEPLSQKRIEEILRYVMEQGEK